MKSVKQKISLFLNSRLFVCIFAFIVLLSHTFSVEPIAIGFVLCVLYLGFLFADSGKFLLPCIFMTLFSFSKQGVANAFYVSTAGKALSLSFGAIGVILLGYFLYRQKERFVEWKKSKLRLGIVLLCGAFLLNGFLNFKNCVSLNFIFALCVSFSLFVPYFIFVTEKNLSFADVSFALQVASVVLTLEVFFLYLKGDAQFVNGAIVKESLGLGWGIWNNAGGILTICLPIFFYESARQKRGYIPLILGLLSYGAVVLTFSRSSLLVASLLLLICFLYNCFFGEQKKLHRYCLLGLFLLLIVGVIVFREKVSTLFADYIARGWDDNGRFDIYRYGLDLFLKYPIFGYGFTTDYQLAYVFNAFLPFRYHNTFIELLACTGAVGLVAYLFHRYQTVVLVLQKKKHLTFSCFLCVAGLLLTSLFDNHFFNVYPLFYYGVLLASIEKGVD